jgi:hypothetical protein
MVRSMTGVAPGSSCPLSSSDHKQTAHHPDSLLPCSVWTSEMRNTDASVGHCHAWLLLSTWQCIQQQHTLTAAYEEYQMQPTHDTKLHT